MQAFLRLSLIALLVHLGGCATGGSSPAPAPIEERKPVSRPVQSDAPTGSEQPAISNSGVRVHTLEPAQLEVQPLSESNPSQPQSEAAPSSPSAVAANPAVVALFQQASRHEDSGNLSLAIAELERGLRIEPGNALLWHRLAVLHTQQGNWQQARELARKSNTLAGNDHRLVAANQELIRQSCRQAAGSDCN